MIIDKINSLSTSVRVFQLLTLEDKTIIFHFFIYTFSIICHLNKGHDMFYVTTVTFTGRSVVSGRYKPQTSSS